MFARSARHIRRRAAPATVAALVLLAARADVALAHGDAPPAPHDLPSAWTWDPVVLAGLALAAAVYGLGLRRLWRRTGTGRAVGRWRAAAFGGGLLALFAALVSPLDALSEALFSAHMVQHLLLILTAAPLLVLGAPTVPVLLALPKAGRRFVGSVRRRRLVRAAWRVALAPVAVLLVHAATVWVWHAPALYGAALEHPAVHALEHAAFLLTAVAFWWVVLAPGPKGALHPGAAVIYLFVATAANGVLGLLITFAGAPLYAHYVDTAGPWGLAPLQDQQLAGLIMWVPAGTIYGLIALVIFARWLEHAEDEDRGSLGWLPDDASAGGKGAPPRG